MVAPLRSLNFWALVLTGLGLLQMLGYALGSANLRGVGAMTVASPFPKVFTDVDGLETFASTFVIAWKTSDGQAVNVPLTPEVYARLEGPYNRRNVYGAALAYAPRLPAPLWQAVFCQALGPGGALRSMLAIPADARDLEVIIRTKTRGRNDEWRLRPPCLP